MNLKLLVFLSALIVSFLRVDAQLSPVIHFNENDGLAGNYVRDIVLDSKGVLWVATNNGISRFDGTEFDNIYKTNGLPSNRVGALAVGEKGEIYAGCSKGGLVVIRNDSVINQLKPSVNFKEVFRTLYYSNYYHALFVGTESGLYVLYNRQLVPVKYNKDLTNRSVILSISGNGPEIYFTVFKGNSLGFYQLKYNLEFPAESYALRISNWGRFASALIDKNLFSADQNRIYRYHTDKLEYGPTVIRLDTSVFVWELCPYKEDLMWVGTIGDERFKGDILLYDLKTNQVRKSGLPQNIQSVNAIYYDAKSDVTWFGRDNGLTAFKETPFSYIDFRGKEAVLDADFLGDSLMILTENSVLYCNNWKLEPIVSKEQVRAKAFYEYYHGMDKYGKKFKLLFDIASGFELASFGKDRNKLYVKTGKGVISIPDLQHYIPMGVGNFTVLKDGSAYTVEKYNPLIYRKSLSKPLDYEYIEDTSGTSKETLRILESNGVLYFASKVNGLLTINGNNRYRLNDLNSRLENNLKDIDKDPDGNIWCLSESDKLYLLGYRNKPYIAKEIDLYNINGLIGNSCKWLQFTADKLYIATNEGLNVMSIKSLMTRVPVIEHFYDENNGYKFIAATNPVMDSEGNVLVHTDNEVILIKPDNPAESVLIITIDHVTLNNKPLVIDNLNNRYLPFSTKQISFTFKGIKYPSALRIGYRYKINDEAWINGNKVNMQSLRSGAYVIHLELKDYENNQVIGDEIRFTIAKPFWLTPWFISMLIILIGLLTYLIIHFRLNIERKRQNEKTKLLIQNAELQLRSLQIQMNPHFMFNALTCLQNFILSKDVPQGLNYLSTLSAIFRSNLENASKDFIRLSQEIEFLTKYIEIEKLRFPDKLTISIVKKIQDPEIMIPPMIIQPLIENAIIHGISPKEEGGYIRVTFESDEQFVITIEDNGIGREASKRLRDKYREHLGLSVVQKRLKLLNKLDKSDNNRLKIYDLYDDNGIAAGTKVVIHLTFKTDVKPNATSIE